jgi:hypothetical protein
MNKHVLFAAVAATLFSAPVHAVKINNHALTANGGSVADIQGTAPNVFDALRTAGNAAHFDAVGRIGDCTGTWLGTEGEYAWVLTAARCVRNTHLVHAADHLTFTNKAGIALAGGVGSTSYIHPKRINRPTSVRDAGTDIALVRMKRLPASDTNAPVAPVIYDGKAEAGLPVGFVAYGSAFVNNTNVNAVWPTEGERRAWGESKLDGVTENGHALFANYVAASTTNWAGLTTSDAGSAWWQERDGQWQIVATTSSGTSVQSLGARMSTYASWVKDLFPNVGLADRAQPAAADGTVEITETREYVSPQQAWATAYVKSSDQPKVVAPTGLYVQNYEDAITMIKVPVVHAITGEEQLAVLRARRYVPTCGGNRPMNNYSGCASGNTFRAHFELADNPLLTGGNWRGRFLIDARDGSSGSALVSQFGIDIDVAIPRSPVTTAQGTTTANFGPGIAFTIPTQAAATGPASRHSVAATSGTSTITVQARDAVTQAIVPIKLRAQRNNGCNDIAMNNVASCGQATSTLKVSFDAADNPALPAGRYVAAFNVHAATLAVGDKYSTLPIELDINLLP